MTPLLRLGFCALALSAVAGCNHSPGQMPPDGGNWPPDGGNWPPDGGNVPPDGGNPQGSRPMLRQTLGIDLAQVSSFVVLSGASNSRPSPGGGFSPMDGDPDGGVPPGPQLLALTLDGDAVVVTLVEEGNPQGGGVVEQPPVTAIFPTTSWVIFSAPGFRAYTRLGDGSYEPIGCSLIAANRDTEALYCAPLLARSGWSGRDAASTIRANAAGDVVYTFGVVPDSQGSVDPDSARLYRITLGGAGGPSAAPAFDYPMLPFWFEVNAAGDLYVNYPISSMDPSVRSEVIPAAGGGAFTVQGAVNRGVVTGKAGDVDEDTFYIMAGGGGGEPFEGTIRAVTKNGSSFVETPLVVTLANVGTYFSGLYRLADGIYMFSDVEKALVRVIADGALVANPTPMVLDGIDRILGLDGTNAIFPRGGRWVFIAATGTGYEFVRHDGVTRQDIPFDPTIDVRSFTVSTSGAIEFLGIHMDTQEKVRGSIAAGSTVVTITSAGVLDPAQVVVFTQIN